MIDRMLIEKRYGDGLWSELYLDMIDVFGEADYLGTVFAHWERENGREPWPA